MPFSERTDVTKIASKGFKLPEEANDLLFGPEQDARRCELIDLEHKTPNQIAELKALQFQAETHFDKVAPPDLEGAIKACQDILGPKVLKDIMHLVSKEGHSLLIVGEGTDAWLNNEQVSVEVCGDFTEHARINFYGDSWMDAVEEAADASREWEKDTK